MSDPATFVERVQRRLRRHLHRHPSSPWRVARRLVLDTKKRRAAARGCPPFCPCADVDPACPQWEGTDDWPAVWGCPRCGAPRENQDVQRRAA